MGGQVPARPPAAPDLRLVRAAPAWEGVAPSTSSGLAPATRSTASTVVLVVGLTVGALVAGATTLLSVGPAAAIAGTALAALPFLAVTAWYLWLDRWEPHPRGAILVALGWGAFVATSISLVASLPFVLASGGSADQFLLAVVEAPVVEEIAKGLGVVLVARRHREEFHNLVDGLVISGLVGAGFAFTENILYIGGAFVEGQASGTPGGALQLGLATFVLRGVASPFAHSLFTAATGLGVAHAERVRGRGGWWAAGVGLVVAIVAHAVWNLAASGSAFVVVYVVAMVPLFVAMQVVATRLRRREGLAAVVTLGDYVGAGWLYAFEPPVVGSLRVRRQFTTWATSVHHPPEATVAYQRSLIRLAHLRQRVHRDTTLPGDAGLEARLLERIRATRPPHVVGTRT